MTNNSETTTWTTGDRVICNGYPGTVTEVCIGALTGMLVVRVPGGEVCVSGRAPNVTRRA